MISKQWLSAMYAGCTIVLAGSSSAIWKSLQLVQQDCSFKTTSPSSKTTHSRMIGPAIFHSWYIQCTVAIFTDLDM